MKIIILLLFLTFIIIPITFLQYFTNKNTQENLTTTEIYSLTLTKNDNSYSFPYEGSLITITPNKSSFSYSSHPFASHTYKYELQKISDLKFNLTSPGHSYQIILSFSQSPVTIIADDFKLILKTQKTNNNQYNLILYEKNIGKINTQISNNQTSSIQLETSKKDIIIPPILCSLFTGFLIFDNINSLHQKDYDKLFN